MRHRERTRDTVYLEGLIFIDPEGAEAHRLIDAIPSEFSLGEDDGLLTASDGKNRFHRRGKPRASVLLHEYLLSFGRLPATEAFANREDGYVHAMTGRGSPRRSR
jgi:hypothetical protein